MTGRVSYEAGRMAEEQVAAAYARKGIELAAKRWRGTSGEIDLVLRDGEDLIFVEVKKAATHDIAAQRLDRRQMARICSSASEFVAGEPRGQLTYMRFDVALVDDMGRIELREGAFWEQ